MLRERFLYKELYTSVVEHTKENMTTFFLYNLSGQLTGYHTYRPDRDKVKRNHPKECRYYTHGTGVWGLETYNKDTTLYVTEGVFDACRLHNLGLSAIAVLSNDPKQLKSWFRALNNKLVAVCDGDAAGRKLASLCDEAIFVEDKRDLGDLTEEEVITLLRNPYIQG